MNPLIEQAKLLKVRDLSVSVCPESGTTELIHNVSLELGRNEVLTLLGESGSGKTILSRSLTRLFPATCAMAVRGSVMFDGQELLSLDEPGLARVRRHRLRYVFQAPVESLNPLANVRTQMRLSGSAGSTDDAALQDSLRLVDLDADRVLDLFPHQLSTGMAQRVCIAMAMLPSPALLVADEPTSAVDAALRNRLIDLLFSIRRRTTMALIFITHDLDAARNHGDRIAVMFGGRILETAPREAFFARQFHPYSRLLVDAQPRLYAEAPAPQPAFHSTSGEIPARGCRFHLQCAGAEEKCRAAEPELEQIPGEREVRCFFWK